MEIITIWVLIDRAFVILTNIMVIIGVVNYDKHLFWPYFVWIIVAIAVNTTLSHITANLTRTFYIYLAWAVICFEVYAVCVIDSEFKTIPFTLHVLEDYLQRLGKDMEVKEDKKLYRDLHVAQRGLLEEKSQSTPQPQYAVEKSRGAQEDSRRSQSCRTTQSRHEERQEMIEVPSHVQI